MKHFLELSRVAIENEEDSEKISKINDEFHAALRKASHNEIIITIGGNLRSIDNSLRKAINRLDNKGVSVRHKEHEEILNSIVKHEAEKAEKLMVAHVRDGLGKVIA